MKFEFYGIPRLRAGVAEFVVNLPEEDHRLGTALQLVRMELPQFDGHCFDGDRLRTEFIINISGKHFTRELDYSLEPSDTVLILSSDAGG